MADTKSSELGDVEKAWLRTRNLLREVSGAAPLPDRFSALRDDLRHFTWVFKAFIMTYNQRERRSVFFSDEYFLRKLEETIRGIESEALGRVEARGPTEFESSERATNVPKLTTIPESLVTDIPIYKRVLSGLLEPSQFAHNLVPENHSYLMISKVLRY
jgi:hypothetical protein